MRRLIYDKFFEDSENMRLYAKSLKTQEKNRRNNLITTYVMMIAAACVPFLVVLIRWLRFSR